MPSPKRNAGGRKAQQTSARDFERSNSTADAFLGGKQKAWMIGQLQETSGKPLNAEPSHLISRIQNPVPNASPSPRNQTVVHPKTMTTSTPASVLPMKKLSNKADNVLPSPSPSLETRRQSIDFADVVDLEDEADDTFAPGGPLAARLKELVAKLGSVEQVEKCPEDVARSSNMSEVVRVRMNEEGRSGSRSSSDNTSLDRSSTSLNQPRLDLTTHPSPLATSSKRTQESTTEPRKRLQGFQQPPHKELYSQPSTPASGTMNEGSIDLDTPLIVNMSSFRQVMGNRLESLARIRDRPGIDVERKRLALLLDACTKSDPFYLCLHQLFCLDNKLRRSNRHVPGLEDVHRSGLNTLNYLLLPNEQMTTDAIDWFSIVPVPIKTLDTTPALRSGKDKVMKFLENLASHMSIMTDICARRRSPLVVEEMLGLFNITSFIFLQILFRATLRELCTGQQDQCTQAAEAIFPRNYKETMNRLANPGSLPRQELPAYNQSIVTEYERIVENHQRHIQLAAPRTMAPPQLALGQSRMTDISPTQQTRQQPSASGHPPHTSRSSAQNIPNINTRVAQQIAPRSSSNPVTQTPSATTLSTAPVAGIDPSSRQAHSMSPYQTVAHDGTSIPQTACLTQSPTTFSGLASPVAFTNLSAQAHGQMQWRNTGVSPSNVSINARPGENVRQQGSSVASSQQQVQRQPPTNGPDPCLPPQQPRLQPVAQRPVSHNGSAPHSAASPLNRFIRYEPATLPAQSNLTYSALHQAHRRSPFMSTVNKNGNSKDAVKHFTFIEYVIMPQEALSKKKKYLKWNFAIDPRSMSSLAQETPGAQGAPSTRAVKSGSRLCRIRCIKLASTAGLPSQGEWVVADNVWPKCVSILLNGIALDVRRKSHHSKDLPIDVTQYLKIDENQLVTAIVGFEDGDDSRYAIGVELIQVQEESEIKQAIPTLERYEAQGRILERSRQTDPDVQVIHAQTIIELKDPFSASPFKIPVRGLSCRHYQCFDRDIFLETRNAKDPTQPCEPDAFKCPICGGDVRPPNLVEDGFLRDIANTLQELGGSDIKAVVLHDNGVLEYQSEDKVLEDSDDETGEGDRPHADRLAEARAGKAPEAGQSTSRGVIEID